MAKQLIEPVIVVTEDGQASMVTPPPFEGKNPAKPAPGLWRPVEAVGPTAVDMADGCLRKWYLEGPLGIKPPQRPEAELGVRLHACVEGLYKYGSPLPPDIAPVLGPHLPPRDKGVYHPEIWIATAIPGWVDTRQPSAYAGLNYPMGLGRLVGQADLLGWQTEEFLEMASVDDLKTKKDFKYLAKPNELARDYQMIIYGRASLAISRAPKTTLRHINLRTEGALAAMPVQVVVSKAWVEDQWHSYQPLLHSIRDLAGDAALGAQANPWRQVKPTPSHCSKYAKRGERFGCNHAATCYGPDGDNPDGRGPLVPVAALTAPHAPPPHGPLGLFYAQGPVVTTELHRAAATIRGATYVAAAASKTTSTNQEGNMLAHQAITEILHGLPEDYPLDPANPTAYKGGHVAILAFWEGALLHDRFTDLAPAFAAAAAVCAEWFATGEVPVAMQPLDPQLLPSAALALGALHGALVAKLDKAAAAAEEVQPKEAALLLAVHAMYSTAQGAATQGPAGGLPAVTAMAVVDLGAHPSTDRLIGYIRSRRDAARQQGGQAQQPTPPPQHRPAAPPPAAAAPPPAAPGMPQLPTGPLDPAIALGPRIAGLAVLLDCAPAALPPQYKGLPVRDGATYVLPYKVAARTQYGVVHEGCGEYKHAVYAAAANAANAALTAPPAVYVLDSRDEVQLQMALALAPRAELAVRSTVR